MVEAENMKVDAAARDAEGIAKPPHVLAAEAAMESLATTPLTMRQRLTFDLARVAGLAFAADRQEAVAARIRDYQRVAMECIRHYSLDGFDRERIVFWRKIDELSRPPVKLTERERVGAQIAQAWRGGPRGCPELDELFAALKPSERIKSWNWQQAVVAGPEEERVLTRRALRLRSRPNYSNVTEDQWVDRYGPIQPAEAGAPG
jgi:hypothetical protein